jgi:hypothetical protein
MRLYTDPEILELMCSNQTVYEMYFSVPDGKSYLITDLQQAMCSFRINVTLLMEELVQDLDGVSDLIQNQQVSADV